MLSMLSNWQGEVIINGQNYNGNKPKIAPFTPIHINLKPMIKKAENESNNQVISTDNKTEYKITVKSYMTKKATDEFDFMKKWNNDNPMPFRTMSGEKIKETKGMVYMRLHGDIYQEITCNCIKCGKSLTNPVSRFFGIGPECGGHNYTHPFESDEQLRQAVLFYKKQLIDTIWEGWVVKSSITEEVVINASA